MRVALYVWIGLVVNVNVNKIVVIPGFGVNVNVNVNNLLAILARCASAFLRGARHLSLSARNTQVMSHGESATCVGLGCDHLYGHFVFCAGVSIHLHWSMVWFRWVCTASCFLPGICCFLHVTHYKPGAWSVRFVGWADWVDCRCFLSFVSLGVARRGAFSM